MAASSSGVSVSTARAKPAMMPASLWMIANRADGGSKLSATIIGPRMSNMDEVPVPFEMASWVSAGSSPAASPRA